ncbi:MAG: hypothetical protein EBY53_07755 [Rhodobacteraceae bacterium]|nr:hypothetical protein [Paracoccaceae bacterium]
MMILIQSHLKALPSHPHGQTAFFGRFAAGASLMGFGGVLAGGCTIGAGLSGIPSLSIVPITALLAIGVGAVITHRLVDAIPSTYGSDGQGTIPHQQPAE